MSLVAHTLNHFAEDLSTKPPSIIRTSTEFKCVVLALSDQTLLPKILQSLRLPPKQSALCKHGISLVDCHPKQCRSFPRSHLNLCFPQAYPSSLPPVNRRIWLSNHLGLHSSQNFLQKLLACLPAMTEEIAQIRGIGTHSVSLQCLWKLCSFVS